MKMKTKRMTSKQVVKMIQYLMNSIICCFVIQIKSMMAQRLDCCSIGNLTVNFPMKLSIVCKVYVLYLPFYL